MEDKNFEDMIEQVLDKLDKSPGNHMDTLRPLAKDNDDFVELQKLTSSLEELIQFIRVAIKYLLLDIEATRRERDELNMELEDKE